MSLEMAHKVILPPKKIISRSFLNSGTLIVIIDLVHRRDIQYYTQNILSGMMQCLAVCRIKYPYVKVYTMD